MKKLTLALGGGGTKGFAHIGVIKEILRQGYEISAIAGTSAGGIVGALYACGYEVEEIESFAQDLDYGKMFSINLAEPPSLLSLSGFFTVLNKYIGKRTFDSLRIPFAVSTVDNNSGEEFIINKGNVLNALKATTAVSGVFPPYIDGKRSLVDGGVLNPVPVNIARWLDENVPVVAVSLTAPREDWAKLPTYEIPNYLPIPGFITSQISHLRISKSVQTFTESMDLMMNMIAWMRLKEDKPDVIVVPDVFNQTMYEKVNVLEMVKKGEEAMRKKEADLARAFNFSQKAGRWLKIGKTDAKRISL